MEQKGLGDGSFFPIGRDGIGYGIHRRIDLLHGGVSPKGQTQRSQSKLQWHLHRLQHIGHRIHLRGGLGGGAIAVCVIWYHGHGMAS